MRPWLELKLKSLSSTLNRGRGQPAAVALIYARSQKPEEEFQQGVGRGRVPEVRGRACLQFREIKSAISIYYFIVFIYFRRQIL